MNAISSDVVAVSACAATAQCAIDNTSSQNHAENQVEFSSSKIESRNWGGPRANSGGARANSGGPRANAGGARPNSGPKPRVIQAKPLGPRWYVVELMPGAGQRVIRDIIEGESREGRAPRPGFRAEMPMIATRRLRRGVWVALHEPMFPGYGLVQFDAIADDWAPIRHIDGVSQLFTTKSLRPIPLPVGFVEWLLENATERLSLKAAKMPVRVPGEMLRVADGPFTSFPATVVECDGVTTTASVHIFGRQTPVTLPYSSFEGA